MQLTVEARKQDIVVSRDIPVTVAIQRNSNCQVPTEFPVKGPVAPPRQWFTRDVATQFVRARVTRILRGEVAAVIAGLRRMATTHNLRGKQLEKLETIVNYLAKNQDKMKYDEYLSAGYPIASGVIEGACRHVVKDRLERTGMTWTIEGAQSMLSLRCIHLGGQWDEFTQFRINKTTERLHPHRQKLPEMSWNIAS